MLALPSLSALQSDDDARLDAELRLAQLREQAAVVRALADYAEHLSAATDLKELGDQLETGADIHKPMAVTSR